MTGKVKESCDTSLCAFRGATFPMEPVLYVDFSFVFWLNTDQSECPESEWGECVHHIYLISFCLVLLTSSFLFNHYFDLIRYCIVVRRLVQKKVKNIDFLKTILCTSKFKLRSYTQEERHKLPVISQMPRSSVYYWKQLCTFYNTYCLCAKLHSFVRLVL